MTGKETECLARSIEADGLQVFVAVNPTFFAVDADFYPDIVGYSEPDSVFPFFPRHQDLSGEDFDSGIFLDHHVRRRADLLVGLTKHPHESQLLFARMSLHSFDGHLAAALGHPVTGLIETVLGQRQFSFHPIQPHRHGNEKIAGEQADLQFVGQNLGEVTHMTDLAGNEIAHFTFRVKGLSDRSELSVHYPEDLPGAAAQRRGRQASGVKQQASAITNGMVRRFYRTNGAVIRGGGGLPWNYTPSALILVRQSFIWSGSTHAARSWCARSSRAHSCCASLPTYTSG